MADTTRRQLLDPMFTPRLSGQRVAAYSRRTSHYVSTKSITATRPRPTLPTPPQPKAVKAQKRRRGRPAKQTMVLYAMAAMVFAIGLASSLSGVRANHQVSAQVKEQQKHTEQSVSDTVTPSTVQPTAAQVASYSASPNMPRYLDVPKLNVHSRVLPQGVTKSGQLQVPWNIFDAGWYNASALPGQPGAMLVDGHSGIGKTHGMFYRLDSLVAGDTVTVTRGDGRQFTYVVAKVQTVDAKGVDMASMLVSADTAKPGLNLITCAGEQIPGTQELNKRVQVYAVLQ